MAKVANPIIREGRFCEKEGQLLILNRSDQTDTANDIFNSTCIMPAVGLTEMVTGALPIFNGSVALDCFPSFVYVNFRNNFV